MTLLILDIVSRVSVDQQGLSITSIDKRMVKQNECKG